MKNLLSSLIALSLLTSGLAAAKDSKADPTRPLNPSIPTTPVTPPTPPTPPAPATAPVSPVPGAKAVPGVQGTVPAAGLIDINTATEGQLKDLPGIGAVRSKAIIKGRPYASTDDLVAKKIIPKGIFDKIKDKLTVTK